MSRTWLVLDVNYLAWRAFWSTGNLSYEEQPTGVLFGLFRAVKDLSDRFSTNDLVFCFDHGKNLRLEIDPTYKGNRVIDQTIEKLIENMRKQVNLLKTHTLKWMGYKNVFYQEGYEADDVIASVVDNSSRKDEVIIVSADTDLFQVITEKNSVYAPREQKIMNLESFKKTYGISPSAWSRVKAIAGCDTDNVKGIKGVGIKTAAKFVARNKLNNGIAEKINQFLLDQQYHTNLKLVSLPFHGIDNFTPKIHKPVSDVRWNQMMKEFGMKSLKRSD